MKKVYFYDTTIRDGHQSHWAARMTTPMMLSIAPDINEAGYVAMDVIASNQFETCVYYLRENPWERLRLLSQAQSNYLHIVTSLAHCPGYVIQAQRSYRRPHQIGINKRQH